MIRIASAALAAEISPLGAELKHLYDADGRELMTDADPAYWTGHAPILFPIIGELAGGHYRLDGRDYPMARHGFARRSRFEVVAADAASATFRLTDSDEGRAVYPFAFALDLHFAIEGARLAIAASLVNTGDRDLPASFGYHPALAWPLPYGRDRADHRLAFAEEEGATLPALDAAGTLSGTRLSPLDGRTLALADGVFADDALIFDPVRSRTLDYGAADGPRLRVDWEAPTLGVWTKPGAAFVCVEPWWGHADPAGFAGEIWDKPGILRLVPGERRAFRMGIALLP